MRRPAVLVLVLVVAAGLAGCFRSGTDLPPTDQADPAEISVLASDLDTVWEVKFAPDGRVFLTERPGRVRVIQDENLSDQPWAEPPSVEQGESGLMGLALHPSFPNEPYVYVMYTYRNDEGDLTNRIVRYRDQGSTGVQDQVLLDGIPGASIHDGGRLAFGPDGLLYATTGDASEGSRAQDRDDPAGSVLRMTPAGDVPPTNPFNGSYIYTWGHRNAQGLDFRPSNGVPFVSEHGPDTHDEVNRLQAGANYGWPKAQGEETGGGRFEPSVWTTGERGTVAPAGAAFIDAPDSPLHGAFVFVTLKEEQLHVLDLSDDGREVDRETTVLDGDFGRLRAATWGPDEALYISTSNRDGRGVAAGVDDRVIRVPLAVLEERVPWA